MCRNKKKLIGQTSEVDIYSASRIFLTNIHLQIVNFLNSLDIILLSEQ